MANDVSVHLKLIDNVSSGLARLEQKIREIQKSAAEQAKRLAQEQAQASNQSNNQQLSGFQRLAQREREIRERAAEQARRLAQESARASEQTNQQQLSGFQRLAQREREIRERAAEQARRLAQETARTAEQALRQEQEAAARAMQNINNARQRLGVRSHADIQANMERVRGYYRTLAQAGVLSFREQAQAADHMRQRLQQLTNEMGHLTAAQKSYGALQTAAGVAGAVVGGVVGTAMAMRQPVTNALELERHLMDISNTAFNDRDTAGRVAGSKELENAVNKAVAASGIKLDKAVTLIDVMMAGGVMTPEQVMENLSAAAKTVVANRSDPEAIGAMMGKLYGSGMVENEKEARIAQNMIVGAGQSGGNEMRDLSRYLPQQIAEAKASGMHGLKGLETLLTMDEAAMVTAGNPDQANNNVANILAKLNSKDTAKHFEDMGRGDLSKYLMLRASQGTDSVTAILDIIKDEVSRDKDMQKAVAKMGKKGTKEGREQAIDAISMIGTGKVIAELMPDRQARGALFAMLNTEYVDKVRSRIKESAVDTNGPNEKNFAAIQTTESFKVDTAENYFALQRQEMMNDNILPAVGAAADASVEQAKNYPALATAMAFSPEIAQGAGLAAVGWGIGKWGTSKALPEAAEAAATQAPTVAANIGVAYSRLTTLMGQAGSTLARAPTAMGNAARGAMPFIQNGGFRMLALAANPITKVTGAFAGGYALGDMVVNPALNWTASKMTGRENTVGTGLYSWLNDDKANKLATGPAAKGSANNAASALTNVVSQLNGEKSSLGSAISNLMSWKPEPLPVEVNTQSHLTVALAPGLLAQAQSSQSNSTAQKGANNATVNTGGAATGNIFNGTP